MLLIFQKKKTVGHASRFPKNPGFDFLLRPSEVSEVAVFKALRMIPLTRIPLPNGKGVQVVVVVGM